MSFGCHSIHQILCSAKFLCEWLKVSFANAVFSILVFCWFLTSTLVTLLRCGMRFCRLTKIVVARSPSTSCLLRSTEKCDVWGSLRRRVFWKNWHQGSSRQWKLIVRLTMRPWSVWAAHVLQLAGKWRDSQRWREAEARRKGRKSSLICAQESLQSSWCQPQGLERFKSVCFLYVSMLLWSTLDLCYFHVRSPWQTTRMKWTITSFWLPWLLGISFLIIFDSLFGSSSSQKSSKTRAP